MVDIREFETRRLLFSFWTGVFGSVDVVVGRFDCVDSTVGGNCWEAQEPGPGTDTT